MIGVDTLPDAADRPRRPQPHQPVRLHRQPLRVPRRRARCQSIAGPMVDASTPSWPRPSTTSPPARGRLAGGEELNVAMQKVLEEIITDHGSGHLQRQRLLRRLADRGRGPRACPNLRTTLDALPELITREADGAVQPLRRVQPPRDAQPLRDRPRAVRNEHQRGGQARRSRSANTIILPAAAAVPDRAGRPTLASLKAVGVESDTATLDKVSAAHQGRSGRASPSSAPSSATTHAATSAEEAHHAGNDLLPAMLAVRTAADALERPGRRRPLAAADLPGDALHPVAAASPTLSAPSHDGARV